MSGRGGLVWREALPEGGHVVHLTIDNRAKLNSLNRALMEEIVEQMGGVAADPELRLAVLSGAGGRAFVGGADIAEIAGLDRPGARRFITLVHRCCDAFRGLPVPVIARIDGFALGAGLELAAACDLRVASENSVFGMPEVRHRHSLGGRGGVAAAIDRDRPRPPAAADRRDDRRRRCARLGAGRRGGALGRARRSDQSLARPILAARPRAIRLQKRLILDWEEI